MTPYTMDSRSAPVGALRQAVPYLRLYQGRVFVIKIGGSLFDDEIALRAFVEQIAVLHQLKIHVILVHGGGPQTTRAAERLGVETRFVGGRRVTSEEALGVATMVMNGELSTRLTALFREIGVDAVGLCGVDGGLVVARKRPTVEVDGEAVDFGEVGDLVDTDPKVLRQLTAADFLPVLSPLSADAPRRVLTVNADTIAARIAVDVGADKLLFATGAAGILDDPDDPATLHSYLDLAGLDALDAAGSIKTGMKPKVAASRAALEGGVTRVHIVSAHAADALLTEVFTNEGAGTLIVREMENDVAS